MSVTTDPPSWWVQKINDNSTAGVLPGLATSPVLPVNLDEISGELERIMTWLRRNHNPHCRIVIDSGTVEFLSGEVSYKSEYFRGYE